MLVIGDSSLTLPGCYAVKGHRQARVIAHPWRLSMHSLIPARNTKEGGIYRLLRIETLRAHRVRITRGRPSFLAVVPKCMLICFPLVVTAYLMVVFGFDSLNLAFVRPTVLLR